MIRWITLALAAFAMPAPAPAHEYKAKALEIVHPWTPASAAPGVQEANVYMVVRNTGAAEDRLLAASTSRAKAVSLTGGAIVIKPLGETALTASGSHLRLTGLKKPLHAYDTFMLQLHFAKAGRVSVEVHVEEVAAKEAPKH